MNKKAVMNILMALALTGCGDAPEAEKAGVSDSGVEAKAKVPANAVDVVMLAGGMWSCSINGNSQQWKFDEKNGFTMNGESGSYEISGSSMSLVMGQHAGAIEVTTLTNDKLVFEDSEGVTHCEKAKDVSGKPTDSGGLAGRGRQINFAPF